MHACHAYDARHACHIDTELVWLPCAVCLYLSSVIAGLVLLVMLTLCIIQVSFEAFQTAIALVSEKKFPGPYAILYYHLVQLLR